MKTYVWPLALPLALLVAAERVVPGVSAGQAPTTTEVEDAQVYTKVCSGCHAADTIKDSRRSRAQWDVVIEKMVAEGAVMTDREYEAIVRYLLSKHGRVNVNTASAEDLSTVLTLSREDVERIVAQRKKARFETFDELAAVEGIDVPKLSAKRSALEF